MRTLPKLLPYLFVYALLPVAYCVSLRECWRQRRSATPPWDSIALLGLVGTFLLLEVSSSLNWLRLFAVAMPAVILSTWLFSRLPDKQYHLRALVWIVLCALSLRQSLLVHSAALKQAEFPGGMIATNPQTYEKLLSLEQRTQPGEFFLQAGWPGVYLPLRLRNPLYVATVESHDAPRPEDIEMSIAQIRQKPVLYILWTGTLDSHCRAGQLCVDGLSPFRNYLRSAYICIETFPDGDTLWQRSAPEETTIVH